MNSFHSNKNHIVLITVSRKRRGMNIVYYNQNIYLMDTKFKPLLHFEILEILQ